LLDRTLPKNGAISGEHVTRTSRRFLLIPPMVRSTIQRFGNTTKRCRSAARRCSAVHAVTAPPREAVGKAVNYIRFSRLNFFPDEL
jgi:hypothetical protein